MHTHLILWDIDHTLIEAGNFSSEVLAASFEALSGVRAEPLPSMGRTDVEIVRFYFQHHFGRSVKAPSRMEVISAVETTMSKRMEDFERCARLTRGALEVLARVAQVDGALQATVSGNVRQNAIRKLDCFSLGGFFDFEISAFGSEADSRSELILLAVRRAALRTSEPTPSIEVTYVGDATADMIAARRAAVRSVAVATGTAGVQELRDAGADVVLRDLADAHQVLLALGIAQD